jgi:GTP pyrophosphokinase
MCNQVSRLSELSQLARNNQTISDAVEVNRLRTMILSMVDVRVVLIKLADRLHNMRTLEALPVGKQLRIAGETLEVFAPLANRLGIWNWKAELEDLCFKYLKPDEYKELATKLSDCCREEPVMSSIHQLDEALRSQGVQITDLCGRPKNLYSIFKKMTKKGRSFEEIYDVRGLRLVVADEKSCYDALHVVHQLWLHVPGKFKDYVVEPKANGLVTSCYGGCCFFWPFFKLL